LTKTSGSHYLYITITALHEKRRDHTLEDFTTS